MEPAGYPASAGERAMKVQEVILRAVDGRLKWYQAAEILGISDRQMRRWKYRYERFGYDGLFDRRRRQPSPKRVALEVVRQVLTLYRARYFDCNVLHFHEKHEGSDRKGETYAKDTACDSAHRFRTGLLHAQRGGDPIQGRYTGTDHSETCRSAVLACP